MSNAVVLNQSVDTAQASRIKVRGKRRLLPTGQLLLVSMAGVLYGVSMQKYVLRDALSSDTGFQGIVEMSSIMGAFAFVVLASRGVGRRFQTSITSLCFAAYALLALASSWRSFSPSLSFVKGVLLCVGIASVYLTSQAGLGGRFFRGLYWTYVTLLGFGLLLGLLMPAKFPLFSVDDFSGRTKLSLFATHPGVLAESCAMLILLAPMLRPKPHWISVLFLFGVNFFAGEKAATGLLIFFLLVRFLLNYDQKKVWRTLALTAAVMVAVSLGVWFIALSSGGAGGKLAATATKLYGDQTLNEAGTFDGRTAVWNAAIQLLSSSQVFGYGSGGAREALIHVVWWSGQAHNSYLDAALTSGLIGGTCFVFGIAGTIAACLYARRELSVPALCFLGYVVINGMIGSILSTPADFGTLAVFWIFYLAKESAGARSSVMAPRNAPAQSSIYAEA